jgi:uncharacterized protein YjiS (DUF1127 family)
MMNSTCSPPGRFYAPPRGPMPRKSSTDRRVHAWIVATERFARRLRVALLTWYRRRIDLAEFAELSDAVLHDIGTTRSEIESWSAEADGQVERTRRHVAVRSQAHLSFFLKL